MSLVTDIADAVVSELNDAPSGTFSQSFTAVRKVLPVYELKDLTSLAVTVVPKAVGITSVTRDMSNYDVSVDIGIQKKLASGDDIDAVVESLGDVVDEIVEYLRAKQVVAYAFWVSASNDPVYMQDHLAEQRLFTSVITLTYQAMK